MNYTVSKNNTTMKAKDILKWVLDEQINTEGIAIVPIDNDHEFSNQQDFLETFFGGTSDRELSEGDYMYVYSDVVPDYSLNKLKELEDGKITLEGDETSIYLFKVE